MNLNIGQRHELTEGVTTHRLAVNMSSGALPVYATPAMICLMEKTCMNLASIGLTDGQSTVGTQINVSHISPSPMGAIIRCEAEITEIDGRKITFKVATYDNQGLIGEGTHERFIVDDQRFMEKVEKKKYD